MEGMRTGITEDELMALGPHARVEVIDGEIVEMRPVGFLHHLIAPNIMFLLHAYVQEHGVGEVIFDGLPFLLNQDGARLKGAQVPDVSFVRRARIPADWNLQRPLPGAPDLAVEVMSPDDKAELILVKTRKYLEAGAEQVWVVYPEARELHQYRREEEADNVRVYRNNELVDVEALFPGMQLKTAEIFRLPPWVEEHQKSQKTE